MALLISGLILSGIEGPSFSCHVSSFFTFSCHNLNSSTFRIFSLSLSLAIRPPHQTPPLPLVPSPSPSPFSFPPSLHSPPPPPQLPILPTLGPRWAKFRPRTKSGSDEIGRSRKQHAHGKKLFRTQDPRGPRGRRHLNPRTGTKLPVVPTSTVHVLYQGRKENETVKPKPLVVPRSTVNPHGTPSGLFDNHFEPEWLALQATEHNVDRNVDKLPSTRPLSNAFQSAKNVPCIQRLGPRCIRSSCRGPFLDSPASSRHQRQTRATIRPAGFLL